MAKWLGTKKGKFQNFYFVSIYGPWGLTNTKEVLYH